MGNTLYRTTHLDPKIEVTDVHVQSVGFSGGTLMLEMAITNPNPFPMEINNVSYKLSKKSDGTIVAEGTAVEVSPFAVHYCIIAHHFFRHLPFPRMPRKL